MRVNAGRLLSQATSVLLIATAAFLLTAGLPLARAVDSVLDEEPDKALRVNFQPDSSEPVCGYAPDFGYPFAEQAGLSFGWNFDHSDATHDRKAGDDERLDTLASFHAGGMWEIAVANGDHQVRASVGDAAEASSAVLNVEGASFFDGEEIPAGQFRDVTETVTVTDGKLTLDQGSAPDLATRINFIEIDAHGAPEGCDEEGDEEADDPSDEPPAPSDPRAARASATLATAPINVNFQSKHSPDACGYTPDRGRVFDKRHGMAFGWNVDHTKRARDRGMRADQRKDTFVRFRAGGKWEISVPKGDHKVKVAVGDTSYPTDNSIFVEGVTVFDQLALETNQFAVQTLTVPVRDGRLTIDTGGTSLQTKINYVDVNSPGERECKDSGPISGDVSTGPLPPRPYGLSGLRQVFGERCSPEANDGRAYFPSAGGRGSHGYVYFHSRLSNLIGNKVLDKIKVREKANDYGVWGYACRMKTGGTSWSVHSWGAAVDTNTIHNPFGQTYWNGHGSNGKPFGRFLPRIWKGRGFYWGLNFNDPMHFQYVSGY